jgi:hypothetical protein
MLKSLLTLSNSVEPKQPDVGALGPNAYPMHLPRPLTSLALGGLRSCTHIHPSLATTLPQSRRWWLFYLHLHAYHHSVAAPHTCDVPRLPSFRLRSTSPAALPIASTARPQPNRSHGTSQHLLTTTSRISPGPLSIQHNVEGRQKRQGTDIPSGLAARHLD